MENYAISYEEVQGLLHKSCTSISADAMILLRKAAAAERVPGARVMLEAMIKNVELAGETDKPVCQSPGLPTVYIRFGENAQLGPLMEYIPRALKECTLSGYIRPSIVHPLTRHNPGDSSGMGIPNFELRFVPGMKHMEVILSAKGCGAELGNISTILTPATLGSNFEGLKRLVLETVVKAGGFPCPPSAIGIGIGGQMDISAKLSREAISTRDWRDNNPDPLLDELEKELFAEVNRLGIGPAGIGGDTSVLALKIGMASTHTAICPVTINFHCWVARRFGVRFFTDGRREFLFQEAQ